MEHEWCLSYFWRCFDKEHNHLGADYYIRDNKLINSVYWCIILYKVSSWPTRHTSHASASGSLHLLFPLPGCLLSSSCGLLVVSRIGIWELHSDVIFPLRTSLNILLEIAAPTPGPMLSNPSSIFLHNIFHHLIYYSFYLSILLIICLPTRI